VLFVVPFDGPEALAKNVTRIVGLQVWQAIDKLPRSSAEALASGRVSLVWGTDPLPRHSYSAAEEAARHSLGQRDVLVELVLWGKVYEYGEGAIVQVYLSIPDYKGFGEKRGAFWPDRFPQPHPDDHVKSEALSADIPQRRYSFDPIILAREVAARYSSPDALERHATEDSDAVDRTGGIHFPEAFLTRGEAAIFVSALVQIFRSNWASAEMLMGKVADNQNTPNDVKTDALLYKAFAQLQQRKSATETMAAARKLSPYAKRVVMYTFLGELAQNDNQFVANLQDPQRREALSRLRNLLKQNRHLFAQSDPWINTAFLAVKTREFSTD
jgi:molybdopterin synthase catalytic subunit